MQQQPKKPLPPPPPVGLIRTHAVAAGSVWETRMKMDQVSGGIKVFQSDPTAVEDPPPTHRKRKSWKQPETQSDPIELRRALSVLSKAPKSDPPCCSVGDDGGTDTETEVDLCDDEIGEMAPLEVGSSEEEDFEDSLQEHKNTLQSIVDLLMWRDVSRSALVFGVGVFLLISSSFAKDLELSLISAISYAGLVYLVLIFLYRSFLCSEMEEVKIGENDEGWVIGEEEAIWVLKVALPYTNEMLHKLRSLFSGDPVITMKLAVILYGFGKCGGQITVWTMSKLVFFGLFTIPKLWTTHSDLAFKYGTFWLARARDSWRSSDYKAIFAFVLFSLFWKFSSVPSRIWMVFMLLVSLRYYHEHLPAVADWTTTGYERKDIDVAPLKRGHVDTTAPCRARPARDAGDGALHLHRRRVGPAVGTKQKKRA